MSLRLLRLMCGFLRAHLCLHTGVISPVFQIQIGRSAGLATTDTNTHAIAFVLGGGDRAEVDGTALVRRLSR